MKNADRIRQMTDEELAEWLNGICNRCISDSGCTGCPIYDGCAVDVDWQEKWLKQEAFEAEKAEQVSPLDRLAAEYDRKHPNGLKFTYSLDGKEADEDAGTDD